MEDAYYSFNELSEEANILVQTPEFQSMVEGWIELTREGLPASELEIIDYDGCQNIYFGIDVDCEFNAVVPAELADEIYCFMANYLDGFSITQADNWPYEYYLVLRVLDAITPERADRYRARAY